MLSCCKLASTQGETIAEIRNRFEHLMCASFFKHLEFVKLSHAEGKGTRRIIDSTCPHCHSVTHRLPKPVRHALVRCNEVFSRSFHVRLQVVREIRVFAKIPSSIFQGEHGNYSQFFHGFHALSLRCPHESCCNSGLCRGSSLGLD